MIFRTLLLIIFTINLSSSVIPEYKAKYKFERDDFSITGIRELKKSNNDDFIFKFNANTLLIVSMNFESIFEIKDTKIISKNYEVKIRPKSVDRDQKISYDYDNFKINSSGRNSWVAPLDQTAFLTDPLNAQIQIRLNLISGMKRFYINVIEMETGESQENLYELDGEAICTLQDKNYDCVILKRFRESDDRITTYYLIPELAYMFYKVIDESPEEYQKLELKELLSFG
ncbi:MAG: hypothetical protein EBW62_04070 [Proteobacteria bacterium]|nr:hypothetical protein [Pseudomonadota bacterium]